MTTIMGADPRRAFYALKNQRITPLVLHNLTMLPKWGQTPFGDPIMT